MMVMKYQVMNSKLAVDHPIYVYAYRIISISEPIVVEYPKGIYEPRIEVFYDVEIDREEYPIVRMKEDFAKAVKVGDQIHYNVQVDDFTKFTPDDYKVTLKLVV